MLLFTHSMQRRSILATLALTLAAFVADAKAADPVRIGFSMAKTGIFASATPSQINAYELWRDQVNAAGGLDVGGTKRPVQFVQYDDQSDPAQAVKIYEKLITQDKVDLLLAPWGTPFHFAVAGVVERYKFPMVGNSAASVQLRDLKPGYVWFTTSALPDRMGQELPKLLAQTGVKKVALATVQLPFSLEVKRFLVPGLKAAGIDVVVNSDYPPDVRDMTALLTNVKSAQPDALIALSYPGDSVLLTRQSHELGIRPKLVFDLVGPTDAFFVKMFGDQANGMITIGHWSPDQAKWPKAKPFFDAYEAKFHEPPDYLDSALAYESAEILQQAVAKAGLDKEKIRAEIANDTFDTINGPVKFAGVSNATTPTMFLQIQKGVAQIVWPQSEATASVQLQQ